MREVSRITINRELKILLGNDLIEQIGRGRNIRYNEKVENDLFRYINANEYFKKGPDERKLKYKHFNFEIFKII